MTWPSLAERARVATKPRVMPGVRLGLVVVSPDWQPRAALNVEHMRDLVAALVAGAKLPPLDVVDMGGDGFALVDGYHRHAAYLAHGTHDVDLRIMATGDRDTARWWSLAANRSHGLKRTNAEKRAAVRHALEHAFAGDMSNDDLAAHCGVSATLVGETRRELAERSETAEAREAANMAAEAAVASNPKASARELAKVAGVSKSAIHRAQKRVSPSAYVEGDTSADAEEKVPSEGPTLAERGAAHAEIARSIEDVARRASVLGGGMVPDGVMQEVDALLRQARSAVQLSAPVLCPAHGPDCSACGGRGWVTQSTANQIARAAT